MRFSIPSLACALLFAAVGLQPPHSLQAADLKVGDAAPKLECKDDSGKVWRSQDHDGKKKVIVYFYPAAMTGGCTKQACGFRDDQKKLADLNAEVIGVSGDEVAGLKLFKKAHGLNFALLADSNGSIANVFGVPTHQGGEIQREVDGEKHTLKRGVSAARWTFVIDLDGTIMSVNTKVSAAEDSQYVIKLLQD